MHLFRQGPRQHPPVYQKVMRGRKTMANTLWKDKEVADNSVDLKTPQSWEKEVL